MERKVMQNEDNKVVRILSLLSGLTEMVEKELFKFIPIGSRSE